MERYVIECRTPEGSLDFSGPQPEDVFGPGAYGGIEKQTAWPKSSSRTIPLPP